MLTASQIQHHAVPLVVCTAYDAAFARLLEAAGVDVLLVGDSLANVMLGLESTREIGMAEMETFAAAVLRGAPATHVTVDLPFGSYDDPALALANARRFLDLGAASVKLEGTRLDVIRALVAAGIPVMGHLGVLPQTAQSFKRVGLSTEDRVRLIGEAESLQDAGVFAIVLENVEAETAREVTRSLTVPTIGIGSGDGTRGQVQVLHDLLGLLEKSPPFAKPFASLRNDVKSAVEKYAAAVRAGTLNKGNSAS
ncbi:MAG: panB [Fibrobacteria bacterium]|jgi:3-methyl-2-oxobutanoate hydroxymethyltransferase|nr:panB [Fibrobacteria bacterium]